MKKLADKIAYLANQVYQELGGGFNETAHQVGFSIELQKAKIQYLRETNIEIFYKNHPIALDKPDFILYPDNKQFGVSGPLILECKFKEKIDDDARQQLKTYLKSAPLNSNLNLKNIKLGIIINFKKKEGFKEGISKKDNDSITLEIWEYSKSKDKIKKIYPKK